MQFKLCGIVRNHFVWFLCVCVSVYYILVRSCQFSCSVVIWCTNENEITMKNGSFQYESHYNAKKSRRFPSLPLLLFYSSTRSLSLSRMRVLYLFCSLPFTLSRHKWMSYRSHFSQTTQFGIHSKCAHSKMDRIQSFMNINCCCGLALREP